MLHEFKMGERATARTEAIAGYKWSESNYNGHGMPSAQRDTSHVEDTDGGERTRVPLLHVALHRWLHRVGELANDGDGPFVTGKMGLLVAIHGLLEDEEGGNNGDGGPKPCCCLWGYGEERGNGNVARSVGGVGGDGCGGRAFSEHGRHGWERR